MIAEFLSAGMLGLTAISQEESLQEANRSASLLGSSVVACGDQDADGYGDVLVASPLECSSDGQCGAGVWLVSGRTGRSISDYSTVSARDWFGHSMVGVDCKGKAWSRVVIASRIDPDDKAESVLLTCLALPSLDRLWSQSVGGRTGPASGEESLVMAAITDMNADGTGDVACVATGADPVVLVSGAGGEIMRRLALPQDIVALRSPSGNIAFGLCSPEVVLDPVMVAVLSSNVLSIAWLSLEGKGVKARRLLQTEGAIDSLAFLEGSSALSASSVLIGSVSPERVKGRVLVAAHNQNEKAKEWVGAAVPGYGRTIVVLAAKNPTLHHRVCVTAPGSLSEGSSVFLYSWPAGDLLKRYDLAQWVGAELGASGANIGDINDDGIDDFVLGESSMRGLGGIPGRLWLFSGADLSVIWTRTSGQLRQ